MYQINSRVRYSEVDEAQNMTMSAIVNYFQDCATFHSHDVGEGIEVLSQKKRAWLLLAWNIEVYRYPKMAEQITVATWAYAAEKFYGYRNFTIKNEQGELLVGADSVWVWLDVEKGRPERVSGDVLAAYGYSDRLPMEQLSRKVRIQGEGQKEEPISVRKHYIDTNHHMNNGQYIRLAQDYLPQGFMVKKLRAEYKKAAVYGDVLYPEVYSGEDKITVTLKDAEGEIYIAAEFLS